ncbi:hypothetical protein V2J09_022241 [Rumex salicifolius]
MNCLIWNSQGAGSRGFARACKYLLQHNKTNILALTETHVAGDQATTACNHLGFDHVATGHAGGIWLLWKDGNIVVDIVTLHDHFIHVVVHVGNDFLHLVVVYAPPTPQRQVCFWDDLQREIENITEPLFVGEDFNCILSLDEWSGDTGILSPDSLKILD